MSPLAQGRGGSHRRQPSFAEDGSEDVQFRLELSLCEEDKEDEEQPKSGRSETPEVRDEEKPSKQGFLTRAFSRNKIKSGDTPASVPRDAPMVSLVRVRLSAIVRSTVNLISILL